ncbi:uncharacterized protein C12orf42 homolog isoform X2 [Rattus norvegicus]|uniref:uncharacterized protein C12orf42 homolog isoform X2 n=1 Tax=Rattus norvegicus TaxID=10116 RepID=UPI0003D074DD|nr:uncharacterized protein C12orf42 homolog isoform X2 [Rattus norvegicus]XP_038936433.1 uncharacterized protein C12orf42 homolog isoform X2 [Rattus norvegicus]XP_038936435.1 uncharacterized protein C12orf42 homolog isoform X2 [Rattus norvegicus]
MHKVAHVEDGRGLLNIRLLKNRMQPIPRCKTTALPCSRFLTHMKKFSSSNKTDKLHFLPFPGSIGTHSPKTGKRLLCVHQYTIPKSPASTVSLDEEVGGEACPSLTPSSEMEEDDLFFTINEMQKPPRRLPKQTWISPFLETQAANKLLKRSQSVNTISLEAAGRHIPLENHPLGNSKGDSGPVMRPFTAIGLCRNLSQNSSQPISCRTSETVQQKKVSASGSPTQTDSLAVCGSALGRGTVATTTRETTCKHLYHAEWRPKAAISSLSPSPSPSRVVKEPLPLLVGSSTRLFSKKLMKACSSVAPRPHRDFHRACSQTLSKPVVNTHTHC